MFSPCAKSRASLKSMMSPLPSTRSRTGANKTAKASFVSTAFMTKRSGDGTSLRRALNLPYGKNAHVFGKTHLIFQKQHSSFPKTSEAFRRNLPKSSERFLTLRKAISERQKRQ